MLIISFQFITMIPDDPSQIHIIFKEMKQNLFHRQTHDLKFRKAAVTRLIEGYQKMIPEINEALKKDLGYNQFMSNFMAHSITIGEMKHTLKNFQDWSKNKSIETPITLGIASSQIQYEPLGLTLVISPWNYPLFCSLPPAAAAICAGNSVILKPSELAPHTSNVLKKLFDKYMDKRYYRCHQGQVKVAQAITKLPFDMICFTGSPQTGRLVAIQAAKNLTPCLLELGGKCPAIIDQSANLSSAALRIAFGKLANCGQTCVGVDHIYVHESIKQKFKKELLDKIKEGYGANDLQQSGDYPKIINQGHYDRLQSYLEDNHQGNILYKGKHNKDQRFMGPVVVQSPKKQSKLMTQEIFGPILPINYYTDLNQVIGEIRNRPKPLALYMFSGNNKNIELVQNSTSSGSFMVNDAVVHLLNNELPFGGVGMSGIGRYHGQAGFLAFSNPKSICYTKPINIYPLSNRFPPYSPMRKKQMTFLLKLGGITYGGLGKAFKYILLIAAAGAAVKYGKPMM